MDNENNSLVKLTWFDKIFKPQVITLPNGHSTIRRRSRAPLILLLLALAIWLTRRRESLAVSSAGAIFGVTAGAFAALFKNSDVKDALIADGLHVLGKAPEGDLLKEAVYSMVRASNGDV